jgi:hypothetical protein
VTEHTVPEGARTNAVPAPASWSDLVDVDPRVSEALLTSLEDAGVAAYATGRDGADHVVVDASMRDLAEAVVAAELPGMLAELSGGPEPEVDPFEAIVAGWDAVPAERSWPDEEDVVRPAPKRDESWRPRATPPPRRLEDEHYVPPPPPIPPAPQTVTRFAIAAIVGGLFVILGLPLLGTEPSQAALVVATGAIVGGIGTLIWRMRDAPSVDDGPDDGAVV